MLRSLFLQLVSVRLWVKNLEVSIKPLACKKWHFSSKSLLLQTLRQNQFLIFVEKHAVKFFIGLKLSEIDLLTDGKYEMDHFYSKVFQVLGVIREF